MTFRTLCSCLAFVLLPMFAQPALAHNALVASLPEDGQTLAMPKLLRLEFNGAVSLLALTVSGRQGEVDIGFTPSASAAASHELALPVLEAGRYVVDWTIIGADGHRISKSFSFTVEAAADGNSDAATPGA